MARKQRGHRPPPQSRQQVPPGQVPLIDPNRQQAQQQQAAAVLQQRIESIAATIFSENAVINLGQEDEEFDEQITQVAQRSIDAALVFGRELWGVQAQRQKPAQKPKRAPRVITEDDDSEE